MSPKLVIAAALAACVSLIACGGGSGGSNSGGAPRSTNQSTTPSDSQNPQSPDNGTLSSPAVASLRVLADTGVPVSTRYYSIAANSAGRLFLSYGTNVLAIAEIDGNVHTTQHNNPNFCPGRFMVNGPLEVSACFEFAANLAFDANNNLYIDDWSVLRKASSPDLAVSTFANLRPEDGSKVSPGAMIYGLAIDSQQNVYVVVSARPYAYGPTDGTSNDAVQFIRKFKPDGTVIENQILSDITSLGKMSIDDADNLYIISGTSILKRGTDGTISTFADLGSGSDLRDIAVGADGSVYVADYAYQSVRKITPLGTVSTIIELDSHPMAMTRTGTKRFALVTDKTSNDSYTIYELTVP